MVRMTKSWRRSTMLYQEREMQSFDGEAKAETSRTLWEFFSINEYYEVRYTWICSRITANELSEELSPVQVLPRTSYQ